MEENGEEYEETIPHCWIDEENKLVRWPKKMKKGQLVMAIKAKMTPAENWYKYKLKKIKKTSGKGFYSLIFLFFVSRIKSKC